MVRPDPPPRPSTHRHTEDPSVALGAVVGQRYPCAPSSDPLCSDPPPSLSARVGLRRTWEGHRRRAPRPPTPVSCAPPPSPFVKRRGKRSTLVAGPVRRRTQGPEVCPLRRWSSSTTITLRLLPSSFPKTLTLPARQSWTSPESHEWGSGSVFGVSLLGLGVSGILDLS